jgi:hypothetical protein
MSSIYLYSPLVHFRFIAFVLQQIGSYTLSFIGSWRLTSLSTIFQLHRGGQFYRWKKPEKVTDLPHVTDQLYHILLYRGTTSPLAGLELTTLVGDRHWLHSIGSCKSNYHTTTTTLLSFISRWHRFISG